MSTLITKINPNLLILFIADVPNYFVLVAVHVTR